MAQRRLTQEALIRLIDSEFTGKERDAETGLDYFLARYYSGAQGRFTSPDTPLVDQQPSDPQKLEPLCLCENKPFRFYDPDGQACKTIIGPERRNDH